MSLVFFKYNENFLLFGEIYANPNKSVKRLAKIYGCS
jgi:hypothetical protein